MAISFIGSTSALDQVTVPTHAVGDLILVAAFCMDGDGTAPTLPVAFTKIASATSDDAWLIAYKIATSTSDGSSGHWGASSLVLCSVFRGVDADDPDGAFQANSGDASDGVVYGPLTLHTPGGTSWVAAFAGGDSTVPALGTPPSGMTIREGFVTLSHKTASFDTNGTVTSFHKQTLPLGGAGPYRTLSLEVRATPNHGALASTLAAATLSASGDLGGYGTLAYTLAAFTLDATGAHGLNATLANTLAAATLSASMVHGLNGTLAKTLAAATSDATGDHGGYGTLANTLAAATLAASGDLGGYGTLANTLAAATMAASGDLGGYGTLAATLSAATLAASMAHGISGTLAATLAAATLTATAGGDRSATLAKTLSAATLAASGDLGGYGTLAATLAAATLDAAAAHGGSGTLAATLAALTLTATAGGNRSATLAKTLAAATLTATATLPDLPTLMGTLAATLRPSTMSSLGQHPTPDTGAIPPYAPDRGHCVDIDVQIETEIDHVLTQYRESPNLLSLMRSGLRSVAEASDAICNLPEWFFLDGAVGDQLTLIGKRLGFPRCHCVCQQPPVFGFDCTTPKPAPPVSGAPIGMLLALTKAVA